MGCYLITVLLQSSRLSIQVVLPVIDLDPHLQCVSNILVLNFLFNFVASLARVILKTNFNQPFTYYFRTIFCSGTVTFWENLSHNTEWRVVLDTFYFEEWVPHVNQHLNLSWKCRDRSERKTRQTFIMGSFFISLPTDCFHLIHTVPLINLAILDTAWFNESFHLLAIMNSFLIAMKNICIIMQWHMSIFLSATHLSLPRSELTSYDVWWEIHILSQYFKTSTAQLFTGL